MLQQYKYHFKRISVLDNYAILESLPTTARTSLLFAQYHDAVDQLSFLQARLRWRLGWLSGCQGHGRGLEQHRNAEEKIWDYRSCRVRVVAFAWGSRVFHR